ncbi:UNVERIFIED_ORG: addiction module antidote protein, HigA family [Clostridium botulinum]
MGKIKQNSEPFLPIVAIPPGESIKECMEALDMTQTELALRLSITPKHLGDILKGNSAITYETALKLESVIGPSAEFWINLEGNYQLDKARIEENKRLIEDYNILKEIPYNEMSKLGWVEGTRNKNERVKNSREFFKVSMLTAITNSYAVAFRLNKTKNAISDYGVLAWLIEAENLGSKVEVERLNRSKLKKMIPEFRKLTLETPEIFYPKMKQLCAECGIALVLVESLPKTYICGATVWKGEKAILALSVRGKKADIFWFTFFHELAHLVEHNRKEFHINYGECDKEEDEADSLARNYLISDDIYNDFLNNYNYEDLNSIKRYANKISIAPCILVGRLLHDKIIDYSMKYDSLRPSFKIVRSSN